MVRYIALSTLLFVCVSVCISVSASAQGFGGAIALSEDHLFIGETGNAAFPGEVYVYTSTDNRWTETDRLSLPEGSRGDQFGRVLAVNDSELFIGAPAVGGFGTVFLYREDTGSEGWIQNG